jgi:hypothetical protein
MSPEEALAKQIERYRAMTGNERLEIALRLHELACDVTRDGIRWQNPQFTKDEVERELRRRLEMVR